MSSIPEGGLDDIISSYYWSSFVDYWEVAIPGMAAHIHHNTLIFLNTVMVFYDWAESLPREVESFIAGNSRPLSAWLYFFNRYANLVSQVIGLLTYSRLSTESCGKIQVATDLLQYLSMIAPALFTGLRAFVLSQSWTLSFVVFALSFLPFSTELITFGYHPSGVIDPLSGCTESDDYPLSLGYKITIVNRTSTIIADIILITLTWWSLRGRSVRRAASLFTKTSLMGVMLRDGMVYFIVLLMLNVVLMILLQLSPINAILSGGDQLSTLMAPLSSILVSHFMLDLQEAYQRMNIGLVSGDPMHTSRTTSSPTLIFAPALGSLAARIDAPFVDPLDTDWDQGTSEDVGSMTETHVLGIITRREERIV
ncbi:hypothetical protein BD311DRAFT_762011 [Dichomitus squalens]|uniref:DUF6533 domain-containing protein n=1 Tax=Dichomitus squalens TaxID=114155 RepID=A0A4Q9MKC3_9APHY|nr:hypothetical protein BD311DRAFT_762011 [Dichomitus squalens]